MDTKPRAHNPISLCLWSSPNIYKHLACSRSTCEQSLHAKSRKSILKTTNPSPEMGNTPTEVKAAVQMDRIPEFLSFCPPACGPEVLLEPLHSLPAPGNLVSTQKPGTPNLNLFSPSLSPSPPSCS